MLKVRKLKKCKYKFNFYINKLNKNYNKLLKNLIRNIYAKGWSNYWTKVNEKEPRTIDSVVLD